MPVVNNYPHIEIEMRENGDNIEVNEEEDTPKQMTRRTRGRPPAEAIEGLISEGRMVDGKLKCAFCGRLFPREKSLNAHNRTHTGEKPYACNYPDCMKSFAQSGQLKTHERLHTKEKCFKCPEDGCNSRFLHPNRQCAEHPKASLIRSPDPSFPREALKDASLVEKEWLHDYMNKASVSNQKRKKQQVDCSSSSSEICTQQDVGNCSLLSVVTSHYTPVQYNKTVTTTTSMPPSSTSVGGVSYSSPPPQHNQTDNNGYPLSYDAGLNSSLFSYNLSSPIDETLYTTAESSVIDSFLSPTHVTNCNHSELHTVLSTPLRGTSPDIKQFMTPTTSLYCPSIGEDLEKFSTPIGNDFSLPILGTEYTSTPLANESIYTPNNTTSAVPIGSNDVCKQVFSSRQVKSRRYLGPQLEASNVNRDNSGALPRSTPDNRHHKMPLSSPSISTSDENTYGENASTPKNVPSSPQHSRVFQNKQNIQLPSNKLGVVRNLEIDGIKPLAVDEQCPYENSRASFYGPNQRNLNAENQSSPSFMRHPQPAKVAMEMTADFGVYNSTHSPSESENNKSSFRKQSWHPYQILRQPGKYVIKQTTHSVEQSYNRVECDALYYDQSPRQHKMQSSSHVCDKSQYEQQRQSILTATANINKHHQTIDVAPKPPERNTEHVKQNGHRIQPGQSEQNHHGNDQVSRQSPHPGLLASLLGDKQTSQNSVLKYEEFINKNNCNVTEQCFMPKELSQFENKIESQGGMVKKFAHFSKNIEDKLSYTPNENKIHVNTEEYNNNAIKIEPCLNSPIQYNNYCTSINYVTSGQHDQSTVDSSKNLLPAQSTTCNNNISSITPQSPEQLELENTIVKVEHEMQDSTQQTSYSNVHRNYYTLQNMTEDTSNSVTTSSSSVSCSSDIKQSSAGVTGNSKSPCTPTKRPQAAHTNFSPRRSVPKKRWITRAKATGACNNSTNCSTETKMPPLLTDNATSVITSVTQIHLPVIVHESANCHTTATMEVAVMPLVRYPAVSENSLAISEEGCGDIDAKCLPELDLLGDNSFALPLCMDEPLNLSMNKTM